MTAIGIIGAGIAGLSLALALRQNGVGTVTVLERAEKPQSEMGPAQSQLLILSPNATRVLRALGLREAMEQLAEVPLALRQRVGHNGFLMSDLPLGSLSEDRFGAGFHTMAYPLLKTLLEEEALAAGVTVEYGTNVLAASFASLQLANALPKRFDLIVCAQGADSTLRVSGVPAQNDVTQRGWLWRAQVPFDAVPESLQQPALSYWLGSGGYVFHGVSSTRRRLYLEACSATASAAKPPLADTFSTWQQSIVQMLRAADSIHREPLLDFAPPDALCNRSMALIGDAAHPMAPHLQQDAALALEDAWVLSRFIDQHEDDPARACAEYQRYRLKRVTLMTERAWSEGQRRMAGPGLGRTLAAVGSSLSSRFLPELAMQRLDWIYRYDCIRGFE